ncbi:telomere-binding protein cav-like [Teleopsis dalmanni]|uniref:telomere-binding protein cav-like n=1 Tax=Teleopsis dalmanni TaxID=139649 RepID=UPI0018CD810C|nr:telomere-binding protein cav-like [Teleopsis dalmanni]
MAESNKSEIYKQLIEIWQPTEEDLQREFSQKELIKLCRRVPCRVNMTRWNAVNDCYESLLQQGRLKNKSEKAILKLVAKGVNRYKDECVYVQSDILPKLKSEWRLRKKRNILHLDYFDYMERKSLTTSVSATDIESTPTENNAGHAEDISIEANVSHEEPPVEDSVQKTVEGPAKLRKASNILEELLAVHTESFTINTEGMENFCESEPLSQDILPTQNDFESNIPLTSTQSQSEKIQL